MLNLIVGKLCATVMYADLTAGFRAHRSDPDLKLLAKSNG